MRPYPWGFVSLNILDVTLRSASPMAPRRVPLDANSVMVWRDPDGRKQFLAAPRRGPSSVRRVAANCERRSIGRADTADA